MSEETAFLWLCVVAGSGAALFATGVMWELERVLFVGSMLVAGVGLAFAIAAALALIQRSTR